MQENVADDVPGFCGVTIPNIPKEDVPKLREAGVGEGLIPGTPPRKAVEYLRKELVR